MNGIADKLKKLFKCVIELLSICFFTPLGRLMRLISPKYKNVWLVSERGYEARDNAYHMFVYLCESHPEINSWYVIDRNSSDRAKVESIGRVVYRAGFKHRLLMGAAERLISTHIMGYAPDMTAGFRIDRLKLVPGIKIFLQHGIIKDDMRFLHYPHTRADIFVTSTKREFEYIRDHFGHKPGVVQMLGLCRYDALFNAPKPTKREILLMPTWREWIAMHHCDDFTSTEYYKAIQGLISSPRLKEILERYDYKLAFYPHYEMQRYIDLFKTDNPRIRILAFLGNDVQQLLMESDLLITDYSSVFCDFAYMGKPEVFYQFDEAEFRSRQYNEGYFSYRNDAFGPICVTLEETLDAVEDRLKSDCLVPDFYKKRVDAFFQYRDAKNRERNFDAIKACNKRRE